MSETENNQPVTNRRVPPGVDRATARKIDVSASEAFMLDVEPPRVSVEDFRQLLMSAVFSGASDVTIQSDQQPRADINGRLYRVTRRPWGPSEVDQVLQEVYGAANARTEINGMRVLDFSYELALPDNSRQRFRVNATGIFGRDGAGVEVTLRALPKNTPDRVGVALSEAEMDALTPRDGLVVIAGATGSGKSTTMAAVTRSHLENVDIPVKIVDIQAPIEYTFRDVTRALAGSPSTIGQSEVGRHVTGFSEGVRSALRRKPDIINVGEARDFETISASLEASQTGHLVYTTTHADSVSGTMRRLLSTFPAAERDSRAYDLVSSLRFIMVQSLIPRIDTSGRVAVREYLRFTTRLRERLLSAPVGDWPSIVNREVASPAPDAGTDDLRRSLAEAVLPHLQAGRISRSRAIQVAPDLVREGYDLSVAEVEDREVPA